MATLTVRREETEQIKDFNVAVSEFENQMELRRLITPGAIIGFKIKSPDMLQADAQVLDAFFVARSGSLESFDFVNPIDGTTYKVRFVEKSYRCVLRDGYYKAEYELKRVFNE